ncbi:hypothetical protein MSG28_004136 [Choristoneura fumiferana]|uniref:Uncharacterized protein n=1 Tax=Choristoneura fumiferana TaxID=7141 RepID=A0ACC0KIV9_CHOFU|nr:hypothetical protein MSG28_004136 [Choristoneura fumiferana]
MYSLALPVTITAFAALATVAIPLLILPTIPVAVTVPRPLPVPVAVARAVALARGLAVSARTPVQLPPAHIVPATTPTFALRRAALLTPLVYTKQARSQTKWRHDNERTNETNGTNENDREGQQGYYETLNSKLVSIKQGNLIIAVIMDIMLGYFILQLVTLNEKELSEALMGVLEM